jgi:hypothetical protein
MGKKAVAFQVKATSVVGLELACGDCPVVLQVTHDRLSPLPKHRCNGKAAEFDIVLELDDLVLRPSRIDRYWLDK